MITQKVVVEGEGLAKPVCVAETLALLFAVGRLPVPGRGPGPGPACPPRLR